MSRTIALGEASSAMRECADVRRSPLRTESDNSHLLRYSCHVRLIFFQLYSVQRTAIPIQAICDTIAIFENSERKVDFNVSPHIVSFVKLDSVPQNINSHKHPSLHDLQ